MSNPHIFMTPESIANLIAADFDVKGGGSWAPVRAADFDVTQWGRWEVWEHAQIGELPNKNVGAIKTGDWVAWDSETGFQMGFPDKKKAEMLAVMQNEGQATRIVLFDGTVETSTINYEVLKNTINTEVARLDKEQTVFLANQEDPTN